MATTQRFVNGVTVSHLHPHPVLTTHRAHHRAWRGSGLENGCRNEDGMHRFFKDKLKQIWFPSLFYTSNVLHAVL